MRRTYLSLILVLMIAASLSIGASRTFAQAGDPWSLIAEVNALRASYGLSPYEVNNALMAAAQSQSEYMSSAGSVTPQPSGDSSGPIAQTGAPQPAASPDYLLIAIGVLALSGLALILIGSLAKRAT